MARIVNKLTDNKFLNIYNVIDPENNVNGYQFAERLGIDSIAFICCDDSNLDKTEYLLNMEYTPPTNEFHLRAFGGSLDKSKEPKEIVVAELKEEAGFDEYKRIQYLGKVFVSTQMNQYCHLFIIFVDKNKQGQREPENKIEAMAEPKWVLAEDIIEGSDWKAITIFSKQWDVGAE